MVTFEDAKNVAETLAEALDPFSVITFGSVARDGMGTDLDLLVVLNDDSRVSGDANLCAHKCLKNFSKYFAVDPFIVRKSKFNEYYAKGSPFLRLILKEGKLLYMKNAILEWLKEAEEELNMASYLLKGGYFKGSCFHAQQVIEKSIKARLLRKGWTLEKTHSIQRLIAIAEDYKIQVDLTDEDIFFVDNIYRGRYPAEVGLLPFSDPSETDAQKIVRIATAIFEKSEAELKAK